MSEHKLNSSGNFDLRFYYIKVLNRVIRKQLRTELLNTLGWKPSSFNVYLMRGISTSSPYIPVIIQTVEKYIEKEKEYISKLNNN